MVDEGPLKRVKREVTDQSPAGDINGDPVPSSSSSTIVDAGGGGVSTDVAASGAVAAATDPNEHQAHSSSVSARQPPPVPHHPQRAILPPRSPSPAGTLGIIAPPMHHPHYQVRLPSGPELQDVTYWGESKEGKPHGRGYKIWVDGDWYEGEWRHGKQHGRGSTSLPAYFASQMLSGAAAVRACETHVTQSAMSEVERSRDAPPNSFSCQYFVARRADGMRVSGRMVSNTAEGSKCGPTVIATRVRMRPGTPEISSSVASNVFCCR